MTRKNPKAHRKNFRRGRVCASCGKKNIFDDTLLICAGCLEALLKKQGEVGYPANYKPIDTHGLSELPIAHEKLDFSRDWILLAEQPCGAIFRTRTAPELSLKVIATLAEIDGKRWLHVSYSRQSSIPTWKDTAWVKQEVIGENRKAFIVLPKATNYVNLNEYCLHMWVPIDHDPLPDFEVEYQTAAGPIKTI